MKIPSRHQHSFLFNYLKKEVVIIYIERHSSGYILKREKKISYLVKQYVLIFLVRFFLTYHMTQCT